MKITVSLIKADVGGLAGHSRVHPQLKDEARLVLEQRYEHDLIANYSCNVIDVVEDWDKYRNNIRYQHIGRESPVSEHSE